MPYNADLGAHADPDNDFGGQYDCSPEDQYRTHHRYAPGPKSDESHHYTQGYELHSLRKYVRDSHRQHLARDVLPPEESYREPHAPFRAHQRRHWHDQHSGIRSPWLDSRTERSLAVVVPLLVLANVLALGGFRLPFLGPSVGFWYLVVYPVYLLYTTDLCRGSPAAERLGYSVTAVLLLLMLGGLAINTFLPLIGVDRPLDVGPVVALGDTLNASLYVFRRYHQGEFEWRSVFHALKVYEKRVLTVAALSPILAVLGAVRLNNGAGDQISLAALGFVTLTVILLLYHHRRLRDGITSAAIYGISLAILLMTSLRGWSVTGHDIQTEYRVFQLTEAHGRWDISYLHMAYNACLSITILPTEISHVVNVNNPYIYKFFFQLLFALCPVLTYTICRRFAPKYISLLAAIYFIGFPTFVNDMAFINRQEVAFLFVAVGLLAASNSRWPQGRRRVVFLAAALGVELSHYSTAYLFLGMIAISWLVGVLLRVRFRVRRSPTDAHSAWATTSQTLRLGTVLGVATLVAVWGGLATQTAGPLLAQIATAISQLGHSNSNATYSLFSHTTFTPQQVLSNYRAAALRTISASPSTYLPISTVLRYPIPNVAQAPLPLTTSGHLLSRIGVPVAALNTDVRQGAAKDEQLFLAAGFAGFLFSRRFRRRVSHELIYLSLGAVVMVGIFTIFPALSLEYGVLRAFQEALILCAPIVVVGSISLFWPFGQKWSLRLSGIVCVGIFISTIGLLPQLLGGYPGQLNLNNSGQYYDIYYVHPQDVAAVNWLAGKPGTLPAGLQAAMGGTTASMFDFTSPSDVTGSQSVSDLYPMLIRRSSWVLLNSSIVHTGLAPLSFEGELITYRYPVQLLQDNKNLVYNNGGAEIYK